MYDSIIIGGGPAGMSTALNLLRNDKKVLIIEKESFGGQIATSPRLENFPTIKAISGLEFSDLFFDQITALGAEFELEEVESIKKENNLFKVKTNYKEYQSKSVIIANGAKHREIGLPNEKELIGKGVSYCAVCDGPFYKDNEIYIIGDANTALQYALLLASYAPKVHMITLFDKLFGDKILQDRVRKNEKIDITHNLSLKELIAKDGNLTAIKFVDTKTKEEKVYQTNNVFIAIGQKPNNEIFEDLVDMDKGFIKTNDLMETKTPGLFAVGDTRKKVNYQVVTACNDGAIAAISAVNYLNNL